MYANHKIQKLNVQVNWSGKSTDLSYAGWQQVVVDWVEQLEHSFDEISGVDRIIQIEHLQLSIDVWDKDWRFDVGRQLKAEVLNLLSKQEEQNDIAVKIKAETARENQFNHFVFFLENGFFTWNVTAEKQQELLRNWIEIVAASNILFKQKLREWLKSRPDAVFRLVAMQHFKVWMGSQVSAATGLFNTHIKFIHLFFLDKQAHFTSTLQPEKLNRLWMVNLYANEALLLPMPHHEVLEQRHSKVPKPDLWSKVFGLYLNHLMVDCKPDWLIHFTEKALSTAKGVANLESDSASGLNESKEKELTTEDDSIPEKQEQAIATWRKKLAKVSAASDFQVSAVIGNAGLVLLAPFLPAFFQKAGLMNDDGHLKNFSLAVNLLQHMAHPYGNLEEQQQLLPKLLCGQAPDVFFEPLPLSKITIFNAEIDSLLSAVIEYWGVLKNTSIDGLRESFLQREGRLIKADKQWLLKVEPKAYDLLIGYLPWTISMIKLPWMDEIIKVEWHTT